VHAALKSGARCLLGGKGSTLYYVVCVCMLLNIQPIPFTFFQVHAHVQAALKSGARCLLGGNGLTCCYVCLCVCVSFITYNLHFLFYFQVHAHVQAALKSGARCLLGGKGLTFIVLQFLFLFRVSFFT